MPPSLRSLTLAVLASISLALTCLSILGCGGNAPNSSSHKAQSQSASTSPTATDSRNAAELQGLQSAPDASEVLATIAHTTITKAEVLHRMAIAAPYRNEVPIPPAFSACIAHLKAQKSSSAGPAGSSPPTEAQLKSACEKKYEALVQAGLSSLINEAWLSNEAAEEGITVDQAALARELKASSAALAQEGPSLKGRLAQTGRSVSDLKHELRIGQFSNKIYEAIDAKVPRLTNGLMSRYYAARKHDYLLPVRRDLRIVRAASAAAALHAKHEIRAGRSFAEVVKQLTVAQPFSAREGLVMGLTPSLYAEPFLAKAIFKAPLHLLTGPVKIPLGYYVFEVTRSIPSHQLTLAQATPQIERQLPELLHNQTLASFVAAFKRRWSSRTDCRAGYVVQGCKQFKPSGASAPSDPYVL